MITFIALAIALVALAMAFVLLPLLRNRAGGDIDRASANLGILKDQLAELENDHRRGSVSDAHYAEAKAELERRVLEEVQAGQREIKGGGVHAVLPRGQARANSPSPSARASGQW